LARGQRRAGLRAGDRGRLWLEALEGPTAGDALLSERASFMTLAGDRAEARPTLAEALDQATLIAWPGAGVELRIALERDRLRWNVTLQADAPALRLGFPFLAALRATPMPPPPS
jgi:hypothetical protein